MICSEVSDTQVIGLDDSPIRVRGTPMSRWETTSTLEVDAAPAAVWERAYADASAWPKWNAEIKSARLEGPLAEGATARVSRARAATR